MIHTVLNLAVAATFSLAGAASEPNGEQERVSDALANSSLRLLRSGFWSVGHGTEDQGFVSACLAGLDSPGRLPPVPGEIARGVSNVYLYQPDAAGRPAVGELVTVSVITVDGANSSALDWFVILLGDDETADCRREEYLRALEVDPGAEGLTTEVEADATRDVGIGDASARLDLVIEFSRGSDVQPVRHAYVVSRTASTVVVLRWAAYGPGPFSGFDAQAEVAAIIAELASA